VKAFFSIDTFGLTFVANINEQFLNKRKPISFQNRRVFLQF